MTQTHSFTLTLAGVPDDESAYMNMVDKLCGPYHDFTMARQNGQDTLDYDREASTLGQAIGSAIDDVLGSGASVTVTKVEIAPHGN